MKKFNLLPASKLRHAFTSKLPTWWFTSKDDDRFRFIPGIDRCGTYPNLGTSPPPHPLPTIVKLLGLGLELGWTAETRYRDSPVVLPIEGVNEAVTRELVHSHAAHTREV